MGKWDKIEIRLGCLINAKGNNVCKPLKRRELNLPKILVSSGHYSKVSAPCLPSIRKQQQRQQSWKKWERSRRNKKRGSWKQKLNEFFGGSIICSRLTTRHEILITASLTDKTLVRSVPRFADASCQLPAVPPSPFATNRTWITKVLQFIYLHREPFLKPAKPGNLSTKLSSIFNWLTIP